MKRFFSVIFCIALTFSVCSIGLTASAAGSGYSAGDVIEYGCYPQSKVTDESLIAELNNADGEWISYNYYSGSDKKDNNMSSSDYMRYKVVLYNGDKYRAVIFDNYRPDSTDDEPSESNSYQDDNGYTPGNVYWFKYEPIKWRIIDPSAGLVLCDTIIDSQAFNDCSFKYESWHIGDVKSGYYGDADHTYAANDYVNSTIREWLNDYFYNTAFTDDQKSNIISTTLDDSLNNSGEYIDPSSVTDKVFLLSYNETYESATRYSVFSDNASRQLKGSDYAKSQGLYQSDNGCSLWRLRTVYSSYAALSIGCNGHYFTVSNVKTTSSGIAPALSLRVIKSDTELNTGAEGTLSPGYVNSGKDDSWSGAIFIAVVAAALIITVIITVILNRRKKQKKIGPDGDVNMYACPSEQYNSFGNGYYGQQYDNINRNYNTQHQQYQSYQQTQNYPQNNPDKSHCQPVQQVNYAYASFAQATSTQQNIPTKSQVNVTSLNQSGVCVKCGNNVPELYNVSVSKDGRVRQATFCFDCTQKFITEYNNSRH